jgi:hypothetical protein
MTIYIDPIFIFYFVFVIVINHFNLRFVTTKKNKDRKMEEFNLKSISFFYLLLLLIKFCI